MQTNKFLSLVRQLIGKNLVTEEDSPSDFSMGGSTDNVSASSDTSTSDTSNTSTNDTSTSGDIPDLGLDNSGSGGAGLTPSYDIDVDVDNENPENQQSASSAPKYRILDVMFDEDDDLNTKVKIQNLDTDKVEIKNLDEIII